MKAILLCGGLGTRLRPIIGENQKVMVDVKGKPFLQLLIDYMKTQNIYEYIFACGYKKEEIENYFKDGKDLGIKIKYAIEEEPLGTGGAIKNCYKYVDEDKIFVVNTDTLFKINYKNLYDNMINNDTDLSIAVKKLDDVDDIKNNNRYGNINIKNEIITSFLEKPSEKSDYINGGIYIIKKTLIETIPLGKSSFENDLMKKWLEQKIKIGAYIDNNDFIDIGTPEKYKEIIK